MIKKPKVSGAFTQAIDQVIAQGLHAGDWREIDGDTLTSHVIAKCLQFAISDASSIDNDLKELMNGFSLKVDAKKRSDAVSALGEQLERFKGEGAASLIPFILLDNDGAVSSTAAMNLALVFSPEEGDSIAGIRYVAELIMSSNLSGEGKGAAFMGLLLLGDERANSIFDSVWDELPDEGRLVMTRWKTPVTFEGVVEFWIRCLEKGCGDEVFGAIVAALCVLPTVSVIPSIIKIERVFPSYEADGKPIVELGRTSFRDYLAKLKPRVEKIIAKEAPPQVMPRLYVFWS